MDNEVPNIARIRDIIYSDYLFFARKVYSLCATAIYDFGTYAHFAEFAATSRALKQRKSYCMSSSFSS